MPQEDVYNIIHNWIYWCLNYKSNFICNIWSNEEKQKELNIKFNELCKSRSSNSAINLFFLELDNQEQNELIYYVMHHYKAFPSIFIKIQDIEQTKRILLNWSHFCLAYNKNFVEEVFKNNDKKEHLKTKLKQLEENEKLFDVMTDFYCSLSNDLQKEVVNYVNMNLN